MDVQGVYARWTAAHVLPVCRVEDRVLETGVRPLNDRRLSQWSTNAPASKPRSGASALARALVPIVTVVVPVAITITNASSTDIPAPTNGSRIALGRSIFFDRALSEPAGTSCASCHAPERAFSGNHGSSIGVAQGSRPNHFASRSTPSLLYLRYVPRFHFHQDDDAIQPSAVGGFFWDGRADSIAELVRQPLLNPDEMNNRDAAQIARKIAASRYAADFRSEFGEMADDPQATLMAVGRALEAFLTSEDMAPFSSKYDAYVRGKTKLSSLEARGLKLFKNPDKGNCVSCHRIYDSSKNPERSLFTDFGYDAVAAPRNPHIPANADPEHYDLGLCRRRDARTPTEEDAWCVNFRAPSLRNVAVRESFMHNGVFTRLRDVVAFYATRATNPMRWYRSGVKFEDVPPRYRGQVNVNAIPYNRRAGDDPALTEADVDAIVAFLGTLTDAAYRTERASRSDR
jgi:cytochrome c peroxidase